MSVSIATTSLRGPSPPIRAAPPSALHEHVQVKSDNFQPSTVGGTRYGTCCVQYPSAKRSTISRGARRRSPHGKVDLHPQRVLFLGASSFVSTVCGGGGGGVDGGGAFRRATVQGPPHRDKCRDACGEDIRRRRRHIAACVLVSRWRLLMVRCLFCSLTGRPNIVSLGFFRPRHLRWCHVCRGRSWVQQGGIAHMWYAARSCLRDCERRSPPPRAVRRLYPFRHLSVIRLGS